MEDKTLIMIDNINCLNCSHWVSDSKSEIIPDCHYKKGNYNCPVPYSKIRIGVNIEKTSNLLLKALYDIDIKDLIKVFLKIEKFEKLIQEEIITKLILKIRDRKND